MTTRYYTYRKQVPLKPGQTVGFQSGKGYYVRSAAPTASYPVDPRSQYPTAPPVTPRPPVGTKLVPVVPDAPGPRPDVPGATPPSGPTDWSSFLDTYGMPDDVKRRIDDIFRQGGDIQNLVATAVAYVRGTPWYAQTYPGISEGIARGIVTNEKDYRSYLNSANQLYQQYFGRTIGGDEFATLLGSGVGPTLLHSRLEARADTEAFGAQLPTGLFGADELQEIGLDMAGIGSARGKQLRDLSSYAQQLNPIYRQYEGRDITRAELEGHFGQQTSADTVARRFAGKAYIGAYGPDIQYALGNFGEGQLGSSDLTALGEEQAGLDTPLGQKMQRALELANQRLQGVFRGSLAQLGQSNQARSGSDVGR